ncbi:hypothetical protein BKA65DRAFT_544397 [Rhexocercosporidium sp. MPI-PUGE-AT-0058]|nr:hypothetical protein BKA65DRAFT_544397 [Rhexocercosporidium sp. MPI-PUGE-AT-0058]
MFHLRTLGYPSYWLSEILTNIIQDNVVTTCRPPRTLRRKVVDIKREYPEKKLSTAPFKQEMAMLAQFFQPLLPFSLPAQILPPPENIYNYKFRLTQYKDLEKHPSYLVLVIWDRNLMYDIMNKESLRMDFDLHSSFCCFVDPSWGEEVNDKYKGVHYPKFREEEVVVWTTFTFDTKTKVASAWMPEESERDLKRKGWECGMCRSDIW